MKNEEKLIQKIFKKQEILVGKESLTEEQVRKEAFDQAEKIRSQRKK